MVSAWFEDATVEAGNDAGNFVAGIPFRGVLHTTEGCTYAAAKAAFQANNSWPHFTIDNPATGLEIYQHVGVDKAARSLRNNPGGVETNRNSAIQIEIVGFSCCPVTTQTGGCGSPPPTSQQSPTFPSAYMNEISRLMRWIELATRFRRISGLAFTDQNQVVRLTNAQWNTFTGWCGHQHVPENTHWDPGRINIGSLLTYRSVFTDVLSTDPAAKSIDAAYAAGVTSGTFINPLRYTPTGPVPRWQMALFLLRLKYGGSYQPPPASHFFNDMSGHLYEAWADQLFRDGITTGCAPGYFCPDNNTTRGEMAVFLLRTKNGGSYQPPAQSAFYTDTAGHTYQNWITQLYYQGISQITECGYRLFCPNTSLTRAQMAVWMDRGWNLPDFT